jgi:hypothetical protein
MNLIVKEIGAVFMEEVIQTNCAEHNGTKKL